MFSMTVTADIHDVSAQGTIRPAALLRYMQTAANEQMRVCGPSNEALRAQDRAFLVSRMLVVFSRAVHPYETLTATARPCGGKGVRFLRCGELRDADGTSVAAFSSVWAFVSCSTRKILPLSAFQPNFAPEEPLLTDQPLRVFVPQDTVFTDCGSYTVAWRDLDQNGHMNNTVYPDLLMGFLPEAHTARLARMTLCFFGEAKEGETFSILRAKTDAGWLVRTTLPDGKPGIEAEFIFTDEE